MEINELVVGGIGLLTTITSGWVSWFFARKKYNAEVDHSHIENMQESLNFYKKLSDDNKVRLEEVIERNKTLERELQVALSEIGNLKKQILDLTLKYRSLNSTVKSKEEVLKPRTKGKYNEVKNTKK